MDHSGMDHGGHSGGMPMDMCSMSMLFTWNTKNLCLIFKWWHIRSTPGLIFSLLAVVALTAAYEALRSLSRRYERAVEKRVESTPSMSSRSLQLLHISLYLPALLQWQQFFFMK
ncbi:hypothetical protein GLAREA_05384 [Glarea lozoyensis ATCC 20868]|uniref:Copper transport protein n=1 Tax=Glarea lozoyensis (strain ATCC 20868 / MF5171) TaxID=1116229 RepID=S3DVQ6_GLAL2|nr:uncharacterized protein GLAREA_05384 [Glarea lozoyensis ATCC 20868]EPE36046.1 hypothetical protein GLAREA_05384 [Glarea lozoyensis ATCC 20868]